MTRIPPSRRRSRSRDRGQAPISPGWFAADRLHRAAAEGDLAAARELIAEGLPLNALDDIGYAPLHHAVRNGWFEMVRLLLDAGADINARDSKASAMTPVEVAATHVSARMVEFLLQFGAESPVLEA